jgi:hypothetical protein
MWFGKFGYLEWAVDEKLPFIEGDLQHGVSSQMHQLDEILFPWPPPFITSNVRDDILWQIMGDLRQAKNDVIVELSPMLGEERGSPTAWHLREVRNVGFWKACSGENRGSVEVASSWGVEFGVLLLVEAYTEEGAGPMRLWSIAASGLEYWYSM